MVRKVLGHLREIVTVLSAGVVGLLGLALGCAVLLGQLYVYDLLFPSDDAFARQAAIDRTRYARQRGIDEWISRQLASRGEAGAPFTLDEILPAPATRVCVETQRWPGPPANAARELAQRSERPAYWLAQPGYSTLVMERADTQVMAHIIRGVGPTEQRFQFSGLDRAACGAPREIVLLPQRIERTVLFAVQPLAPIVNSGNARAAMAADTVVARALTRKWLDGVARFAVRDIVDGPITRACLETWHWGPPDEAAKRWVMHNDTPWMYRFEGNSLLALQHADGSVRIHRIAKADPVGKPEHRLGFQHGGGAMWGRTCSDTGDLVFQRRPTIRGQTYEFAVRAE